MSFPITQISPLEFSNISTLVFEKAGINLTAEKKILVISRLQKLLKKYQLSSFTELYESVLNDKTGAILSDLINQITTNHTFFYREKEHFDHFTKVLLPELSKGFAISGSKEIRIWSAGCSSGEEPYMLVMLMLEFFGRQYAQLNAGILATDISENVLVAARKGVYQEDKLKYLPAYFRSKYFTKVDDSFYQIRDEVKQEVTFRRFNLLNDEFPFNKLFHHIFCRNVMIYFDMQTKRDLVAKFYNHLVPGGMLFIGHSESLNSISKEFRYTIPAGYSK